MCALLFALIAGSANAGPPTHASWSPGLSVADDGLQVELVKYTVPCISAAVVVEARPETVLYTLRCNNATGFTTDDDPVNLVALVAGNDYYLQNYDAEVCSGSAGGLPYTCGCNFSYNNYTKPNYQSPMLYALVYLDNCSIKMLFR